MIRGIHRWLYLALVVFFIVLFIFSKKPLWVDTYYVSLLYPWLSKINQGLWAKIPFSIGDLGYVIGLFYFFWRLFRNSFWKSIKAFVRLLPFVVFLFYFLWGTLYFKPSLRAQRNLTAELGTTALIKTTTHYADQLTELHEELSTSSNEKIVLSQTKAQLLSLATACMEASDLQPKNIHGKAKATLFPTLLSYMGFGGYANPFTHEAQVNTLQPKLSILTTSCHEIAHQWGYAAEEEANYIGIQVSVVAEDPILAYAGNLLAFRYLINSLYRADKATAEKLINQLPKGTRLHMVEMREFWQKYQNPFEQVFEKSYDQYLKANQQQAGIKSYSLVVGLLVDDFVNQE